MTFQDLALKTNYESGIDDLVQDFYNPVLGCAISYDRIAGFFSSSALSVAAEGMMALLNNGGCMRLLACPRLSKEDYAVIKMHEEKRNQVIENRLLVELCDIKSEFQKDHLKALGWMLKNNYLEIRLVEVINNNTAIFHQKVGVLKDLKGNNLTFSGSINESASGWLENIEEFKVFCDWIEGQAAFVVSDRNKFIEFWDGERSNVNVYTLPDAIANKMIEISRDFSKESYIAKYYAEKRCVKDINKRLSLFDYQMDAVKMWSENNYQLLFEMATGTGKTRTAMYCINEVLQLEKTAIVVISCPQNTLSMQWKREMIDKIEFQFDIVCIADGTNPKWKNNLSIAINQILIGLYSTLVIFTTHKTGCSNFFISEMESVDKNIPTCYVGDEAHGLGAYVSKKGLLDFYKYRIGLSATPSRWFDDIGTTLLLKYFGSKKYEFNIERALTTVNPITNKPYLVNYYFHPIFTRLDDSEIEKYKELSVKIRKMAAIKDDSDEYHKKFEYLLFARSNIQKNAKQKIVELERILEQQKDINNLIIFTSDVQIDNVMLLLKKLNILAHRFTQNEGTKPSVKYGGKSEREYLITQFKNNNIQALVAISCLDEGIDIPSAETAILMSSSTNPREYIQRIGRVIRQAPNKGFANIYDIVVEPDFCRLNICELIEFEKIIFKNEMIRVSEMGKNSINNATLQVDIDKLMKRVSEYGAK